MAKRYGRQKKRKALRLIESLQEQVLLLRRRNEVIDDAMRDCAKVLGENLIALPVKSINLALHGDFFRRQHHSFVQGVDLKSSSEVAENLDLMVSEIGAMRSEVWADRARSAVHFRVQHPETGELAYCISREEMRRLPRDFFIKNIGREIAMQLSRELERKGISHA